MIRILAAAATIFAALTASAPAQQPYPNHLIHMLQGFPPGGNVDIIARILSHQMEQSLGQSIVVEAKPGLAGALAAETTARSDPDGYTLLVLPSAHPAYAALAKNVKFKVVDDFTWISVVSFYPFMIVVKADSRFKTLKQLLDEAQGQARRTQIRLGRRRHHPAHHRRADGEPDPNQVPARALSRRGAGDHRNAAGRRRFRGTHHRPDQLAYQGRRVPGARCDRQDALARFPRRADRRRGGYPGFRGDLLDRVGRVRRTCRSRSSIASTPRCAKRSLCRR